MAYTLVPTELIVDGAVTSAKLDTNIAISGTLGVTGELTLATHMIMGDNDKIKIGTGGDLEIYHDGSNSYISNSTGNIYLADTNGSVHIQAKLNEESIVCTADGAVTLYHDNAVKLATTSTGIDVTSNDSTNNSVSTLLKLSHTTTGTAADGIGTRINFESEDDGGTVSTMGYIDTLFTDVSDGAEKSAIQFYTRSGGSIARQMHIDSTGVGIGTTSPLGKLSIQEGSSGGSANANADGLVIDNNAKTGLTILTPNNSEGLIFFADPDDDNIGRITYNHSTNDMTFVTNNSTALTIDSSGRLLVGATSAFSADSVTIDQGGFLAIRNTSGSGMEVRRDSTDGSLIDFQKDGSAVGSIGTTSSYLYIAGNNSGAGNGSGLNFGTAIEPTNRLGGVHNGITDLGSSSNKFKDLYLSGTANADEFHIGTQIGTVPLSISKDTGSGVASAFIRSTGTSNNGIVVDVTSTPNNYIADFRIGNSCKVRIDRYGQLGIGTDNPANKLEIQHGTVGTGNGSNNTLALRYNSTTLYGQHYMDANGLYHIRADGQGVAGGNLILGGDNSVQIWTGSTPEDRVVVDSSGNFGIGTDSPSAKLSFGNLVPTNGQTLHLYHAGNVRYGFGIVDGAIRTYANSNGGAISFGHVSHTDGSTYSEKMRIDSNGQLLISGSVSVPTTPAATLHVNQNTAGAGNVNVLIESNAPNLTFFEKNSTNKNWQFFHNAGDLTLKQVNDSLADVFTSITFDDNGNIGAPSGSNIYNASDQRLKKNITSLTEGISIINDLNPVKFNWIDDFVKTENDKTMYGFVAQEVQEVFSDAVENFMNSTIDVNGTTVENPLRVNEKFMIPILVKAIQEQQTIIDDLKSRIETLENE